MEGFHAMPYEQDSIPKRRKKEKPGQERFLVPTSGEKGLEIPHSSIKPPKPSKRSLKNESSLQVSDRSTPDSLQDSSTSNIDYRTLRRKYLLLEEESCAVVKELTEVEEEVKTLEDEKFALLDQLVVLEGLISPSELRMLQGSQSVIS